ncbi:hypothetical protein CsatA_027980 [Cannabis sativa]
MSEANEVAEMMEEEVTSAAFLPYEEKIDEKKEPTNIAPNPHDDHTAPTPKKTDNERKKELRLEASKWIGVVIFKTIGHDTYKGKVVDYVVRNGWFKVMYDDDEKEEMSKIELLQLMSNPEEFIESANRLPPSLETHRPRRRKEKSDDDDERRSKKRERGRGGRRVNMATASNVPVRYSEPAEPATQQRRPRKPKQPSTYVPLALKESKKDDYYWYWP